MRLFCQFRSVQTLRALLTILLITIGTVFLPSQVYSQQGATSQNEPETLLPAVPAQSPQQVQSKALPDLSEQQPATILRIGLVATRGAAYLQARIEPFRKYLVEGLARPVEIIAFPTAKALVLAHISKQVDYAYYPASAFAQAYASCGCVQPLVAPVLQSGHEGVFMVLVVKESSGIRSLGDLTDKTLALSSTKAAIPYHMAMNELRLSGLDPTTDLQAIVAEETPDLALDHLFNDRVQAALVWSSTPYSHTLLTAKGAVSSYLERFKQKRKIIGSPDFTLIWKSRPVPAGPHSVHKDISKQDRALLTRLLKAMQKDAPDAYDAIERHYDAGYRSVSLRDYAPLLDIATSQ
ncbi:MAG: phosphate/phosphite/phosphonate ABC transporter substrate-binding protein [Cohaesibacter sp.]|nr:phosphate/phosphite/phosphonate ABC transporter substrate-binding protein [Cohaesibacter sp.]MCV6603297.1 phosphate/phosphite/phosphonate ABC transporter substrate-binding protein [Cohaesibacter sp.]